MSSTAACLASMAAFLSSRLTYSLPTVAAAYAQAASTREQVYVWGRSSASSSSMFSKPYPGMQEHGAHRDTTRDGRARGRGGGALVVAVPIAVEVLAMLAEDVMGRAVASIVALGVDTGAKHGGISDSGMGMGREISAGWIRPAAFLRRQI